MRRNRPPNAAPSAEAGFSARFELWLTGAGARTTSLPDLLDALCRFLNEEGFQVRRFNLATDTVHPQMVGMRHVWFSEATDPGPINPAVVVERRQYRIGEALIDEIFFNARSQDSPQYRASPFWRIETEGELHEPIKPLGEPQAFPVFEDLARGGCTAYFGTRLTSFAGMQQLVGLASSCPGGLSDRQIEDLRRGLALVTLHINTLIEFSIKNTLARVYLGRDPGQRVCHGMISLGSVTAIEAAIWFSDLRGFTASGEALDPEPLVQMLNDYLAAVVTPIYAAGGEVLKYIGDAILAVFPASSFADASAACRAALSAAAAVDESLAALNVRRAGLGLEPLRHGVGLHYGEALYGNVGSVERIDFTVIGKEVNIASRIESKTKELDQPLLCSAHFAEIAGVAMTSLGAFELKGVAHPTTIGAPA